MEESDYSMREEHSYANMDFQFVYDSEPERSESPRRAMGEIDIPDYVPPTDVIDENRRVFYCNDSMDEEKENINMFKAGSRRARVCVVGCTNPKRFIRAPIDKAIRKKWRERLSLESLKKIDLVCDRHFSSNLFDGTTGRKMRFPFPDWYIPEENEESEDSEENEEYIYLTEACTQTDKNIQTYEERMTDAMHCTPSRLECNERCKEHNKIYRLDDEEEIAETTTQTCEHLWNLMPSKLYPGMIMYNLRTKQTFVCASIVNVYVRGDGRMVATIEKLNMANLDERVTDVDKQKIVKWLESKMIK